MMAQDSKEKLNQEAGSPFGFIAIVFSVLGCATSFLFLIFLMSDNDPNRWDQAVYRVFYTGACALSFAVFGVICGAISAVRKEGMGSRRRLIYIFTVISVIELLVIPVVRWQ
jgi:hypothetical protein